MNRHENSPGITRRNVVAMTRIIGAAGLAAGLAMISRPKAALAAICFLKGTRVWTPSGERRVEDLKIDDLVVTVSGEPKPIRWIGRTVHERPAGQQWPKELLPIRVARSALAENIPHRDLYISQHHSLYLDGALIRAIHLLNNSTIARSDADLPRIEYFHIKLEQHDVVFAEGAACETLLMLHSEYFENIGDYRKLYGEPSLSEKPFAPGLGYYGASSMFKGRFRSAISPLIDVRSKLEIVRDNLEARAAVIG